MSAYMIDEFTKLVERCAKKLENHTISNASTSHAIVLFKNLLDVAAREKENVIIFSGSFNPEVYDHLLDALEVALAKNICINLIAECTPFDLASNKFVAAVKKHPNGTLRTLGTKVNYPHFILVGDRRYRVEVDGAMRSAIANFDDPATGATLRSFYNKLLDLPTAA